MDHFKYSVLREKWRRYFEEGQRDIFESSSSEESAVKGLPLKENKAYVEIFKMSTNVSKDLNIVPPDTAFSLRRDEIGVTTAVTSEIVGLPAAEHKLEQHSGFPKLQLHEIASGGTTVMRAQQYEQTTYAHGLEPMLEHFDSKLTMNADISQLQKHLDVHACDEVAWKLEHNRVNEMKPVSEQFESTVETRPQASQVRQDQPQQQPRVIFSLQGMCLGDLLRPEFAEQQERRLAQLEESDSEQPFELQMIMTRRPDLLKTNRRVYKLEEFAGPSTPVVEIYHRNKFARKVERMYRATQIEGRNETNSQPDLLKLNNNSERPRMTFLKTLSQRKPYLIQPFMLRNAQYKMKLQPILEEESEQLHYAGQKSDLETYEQQPYVGHETDSDDSHTEDYEDAMSLDDELSVGTGVIKYHSKSLLLTVLICIAIALRVLEGDILDELLNYSTYEDIVVFMFIFFTLLCLCKIYDAAIDDEDESVDSANDSTDNDPPAAEGGVVEPSRRDQMRAGPQPDRSVQPVIDAPDASQPMPPEQDMELE